MPIGSVWWTMTRFSVINDAKRFSVMNDANRLSVMDDSKRSTFFLKLKYCKKIDKFIKGRIKHYWKNLKPHNVQVCEWWLRTRGPLLHRRVHAARPHPHRVPRGCRENQGSCRRSVTFIERRLSWAHSDLYRLLCVRLSAMGLVIRSFLLW